MATRFQTLPSERLVRRFEQMLRLVVSTFFGRSPGALPQPRRSHWIPRISLEMRHRAYSANSSFQSF